MLSIRLLGILKGDYHFEFLCTECGAFEIRIDEDLGDDSPTSCPGCRMPFGTLGAVKARAVETAQAQRPPTNSTLSGYRFCATLQLRTPYRILKLHGLVFPGPAEDLPTIFEDMWQGVWTPNPKSFRELGLDIDDPQPGTMASQIGYVPRDGGPFLEFLLACRAIIDAPGDIDKRRADLTAVVASPQWATYVEKLGGPPAFERHLDAGANNCPY